MSRIEEALKKVSNRGVFNGPKEGPAIPRGGSSPLGRTYKSIKQDMEKLLDVAEPIELNNLLLVAGSEENPIVMEEFNKLRSSIIALTRGEKFLNTLMVTSAVSDEGKTLTALNLSISLAREHDHTVLLVDSDLRRPSVCKYLGIEPEFGLTDCLEDDFPIEKALVKTGLGKLVVLPAGRAVDDPVDLLSSSRMKEIIHELKSRYPERYIIFDTPPALPFADSKILAAALDGVLFVVREGVVTKESLRKTLDEFTKFNLLGVVYNDMITMLKNKDYYY
jgi:exopolysaccharide/PEP-CTERM locus tyrosine autokinase